MIPVRMHSEKFNDPIISQPEPVTLFLPILERVLGGVGIRVTRNELIDRFMSGRPRVVVVYGSRDHPAQICDHEVAARCVRAVWERGALPFEMVETAICDGIAQGHRGMSYPLLSRNLTAASLIGMLEGHGYDAALVLDSCDKRPVGDLAALIEVDLARQRTGRRPFYAVFIPANVMPERHLPPEVQDELIALRERVDDPAYKDEIAELLKHKLKCNTYAMFKKLLDNLAARGTLAEDRKDLLEREIAKITCTAGGTCAFIGTGNTDKLVLAALGLVTRRNEFLPEPAGDSQATRAVETLLKLIAAGDPAYSVANLVRANLNNALVVWSGTGGSMNWLLHFPYLAAHVGVRLTPAQIAAVGARTPQILEIDPAQDKSFFSVAAETADGRLSGIDTLMQALHRRSLVREAPTVDGPWSERMADARPEDEHLVLSKPLRETSGVVELKGNFCASAVLKLGGIRGDERFHFPASSPRNHDPLETYDRKVYFAVAYAGEREAQAELFDGGRVLARLRESVTPAELLAALRLNCPKTPVADSACVPRGELLDRLAHDRLLKILVVIAGEGPRANGIPEMYYPSEYLNRDPLLRWITALITDGRYSGATYGPCIGHAAPEALAGGLIGAIETGDLVYVDLRRGRIDLLDKEKSLGGASPRRVPMGARQVRRRPVLAQRVQLLAERRREIPPSIRALLDTLSSTVEGCVPIGMLQER